ncbi:MAG TPA: radical SAM protein [Thermoplasmatales archaeon]|nr:radical SAM protein [Thermoplasmatales archaeon]
MIIKQISCKTALNPSKLPDTTYALNPYRGCQHNCIYCYVPNVIRIDRKLWGTFVEVKRNLPLVLSKEIKNKKRGIIGISTVTDPYQPVEEEYKVTRYCLEVLVNHDFPIWIQTKSSLVKRDVSIISSLKDAEVMLSIGTLDEEERRILEPYSSSINDRLNTLRFLSDRGVKTSVFFGPIYPTIEVEDLPYIIDVFKETGVSYIMIDRFHMKPGLWEYMSSKLELYPNLYKVFSERLFSDYYDKLRKHIFRIGEERGIKIVDAF